MSNDDDVPPEKRALSAAQARASGFNHQQYVFEPLPKGKWLARLDQKIWGRAVCLICYFSTLDGDKFRLTAFLARAGEGANQWYTARDGLLDLSRVNLGSVFELETGKNSKGKPLWLSAKILGT